MTTPVFIVSSVIFCAICCLLIILLKPIRNLCKLFLHTALGWAGLYIWNLFIPFTFSINIASATIVGILGVPGILLLTILKQIFI